MPQVPIQTWVLWCCEHCKSVNSVDVRVGLVENANDGARVVVRKIKRVGTG